MSRAMPIVEKGRGGRGEKEWQTTPAVPTLSRSGRKERLKALRQNYEREKRGKGRGRKKGGKRTYIDAFQGKNGSPTFALYPHIKTDSREKGGKGSVFFILLSHLPKGGGERRPPMSL